jgi:tRNA1Val (adenine37-N6)-methyltransferase
MKSPFSTRITVLQADVRNMPDSEGFDAIVSNPPYFVDSLSCPDPQRNTARHTDSLSYHDLMYAVSKLLKKSGIFSVIIPEENLSKLESEAYLNGLFRSRLFHIHTTPRKPPKRCLIEFTKSAGRQSVIEDVVLNDSPGLRSDWYHQLTKDFYIR